MVINDLETMTDDELLEVYRKESILCYFNKSRKENMLNTLSAVLSRRKTVDLDKVDEVIESEILWNRIKALEFSSDPVALAYLKGIPYMKLGDKFEPDFMEKSKKKVKETTSTKKVDTGTPILDNADPATRQIHKMISNIDSMGYATVYGDSMIGADLHDGDIAFYNTRKDPKNNDIVVAVIDGRIYIKRLKKYRGKITLKSENEHFEDIVITEFMDFKILGVVKTKMSGIK